MKYLPLYKKWIEAGRMPAPGLCLSFTDEQCYMLYEFIMPEGASPCAYWASIGKNVYSDIVARKFNPLRQNIVLLLACLNNEL